MRFSFEIVTGVVIGIVPFLILRSSLNNLLIDLCGTKVRAEFWTHFTWLVMFLTPVLFATMPNSQITDEDDLSARFIEVVARDALIGVLIAVLGVGLMLVRAIRNGQPRLDTARP